MGREGAEHRLTPLGGRLGTADQDGERPGLRGGPPAADRGIQDVDVPVGTEFGQPLGVPGCTGPVVDHHRARSQPGEQSITDKAQDVLVGADTQRNNVARGGERVQVVVRQSRGASQGEQGLRPPRPHVQRETSPRDRLGHGQSLIAQPDEPHRQPPRPRAHVSVRCPRRHLIPPLVRGVSGVRSPTPLTASTACTAGKGPASALSLLGVTGTPTLSWVRPIVTTVTSQNMLGDYLRARRELVQPDVVGLAVHGVRRVAGLRREEVAMLAGISGDYYLRLEQGRDRNPSGQVLEALARVLGLDQTGTDYLLELATARPAHQRRQPRRETVPAGILQLLQVVGTPAFVEGRHFDVLAANDLAGALSAGLHVGQNRLRSVFLDPAERSLYADWDRTTARLVAGFRASVGNTINEPRVVKLVGELSLASERFRHLWGRHDVQTREATPERLQHPDVGQLTLRRSKLAITGAAGQMFVAYHAEPRSSDADKLALLAFLTPQRLDPEQPPEAPPRPGGRSQRPAAPP